MFTPGKLHRNGTERQATGVYKGREINHVLPGLAIPPWAISFSKNETNTNCQHSKINLQLSAQTSHLISVSYNQPIIIKDQSQH